MVAWFTSNGSYRLSWRQLTRVMETANREPNPSNKFELAIAVAVMAAFGLIFGEASAMVSDVQARLLSLFPWPMNSRCLLDLFRMPALLFEADVWPQ